MYSGAPATAARPPGGARGRRRPGACARSRLSRALVSRCDSGPRAAADRDRRSGSWSGRVPASWEPARSRPDHQWRPVRRRSAEPDGGESRSDGVAAVHVDADSFTARARPRHYRGGHRSGMEAGTGLRPDMADIQSGAAGQPAATTPTLRLVYRREQCGSGDDADDAARAPSRISAASPRRARALRWSRRSRRMHPMPSCSICRSMTARACR